VKPLGYQELVWVFSARTEGEYAVASFDDEHSAFDAMSASAPMDATPMELSHLIATLNSRSANWPRQRVSADEALDFGTQLCKLLPPELLEPLREVQGPLRLKIAATVPVVGDLPWEWLAENGEPFALRPPLMITRAVPLRFPVLPVSVEMPLRAVMLLPSPKDEHALSVRAEHDAVREGMDAAGFEVSILDLPLVEEFAAMLASEQPSIVHYIGHGGLTDVEGNLILQGGDGRSRWVPASELATLLPSSVRLFGISTPCGTENYEILGLGRVARAPGLAGLPTMVVSQYPAGRATVLEFWKAFYGTLVNTGGNVNEALQAARTHAAAIEPTSADWASFSLVIRDQTGVSFDLQAASGERHAEELRAQFAAESANELAKQVQVLGSDVPSGLQKQYEVQEKLASDLVDKLSE
jgi:hypothetical protein